MKAGNPSRDPDPDDMNIPGRATAAPLIPLPHLVPARARVATI
jgi:hypothetical protein